MVSIVSSKITSYSIVYKPKSPSTFLEGTENLRFSSSKTPPRISTAIIHKKIKIIHKK